MNNDKGFVTFAQNTQDVDYLNLAYVQAMNVKLTQNNAKYAVIVDKQTSKQVTEKHRRVFDYVIELPYDNAETSNWKLANEYQIFNLTPFRETIKIESDLLFTRSIEHWWNSFRLRDIVLSTGCKTYRQEPATSRIYRKFFDDNELPDTYNGLMYFRFSQTAASFFRTAQQVFDNWEYLKNNVLKNCREDSPSTDVLYAIAAKVIGVELCTVPTLDFINFVHLKAGVNGWGNTDRSWQDIVMGDRDNDMIRVHNLNQYHPVHYYDKTYITEELINEYERRIAS
jgi:protein-tyrosine-phosphatase